MPFFKRGQFSLFADYLWFNYDDFRDVLKSGAPGEPLYSFESTVVLARHSRDKQVCLLRYSAAFVAD